MVGDSTPGELRPNGGANGGVGGLRSAEEIRAWFVAYLSRELNIPPDRIDVAVPFENFALDSAAAIAMTGDLEDWLGRPVDPTMVYDFPTIAAMSDALSQSR